MCVCLAVCRFCLVLSSFLFGPLFFFSFSPSIVVVWSFLRFCFEHRFCLALSSFLFGPFFVLIFFCVCLVLLSLLFGPDGPSSFGLLLAVALIIDQRRGWLKSIICLSVLAFLPSPDSFLDFSPSFFIPSFFSCVWSFFLSFLSIFLSFRPSISIVLPSFLLALSLLFCLVLSSFLFCPFFFFVWSFPRFCLVHSSFLFSPFFDFVWSFLRFCLVLSSFLFGPSSFRSVLFFSFLFLFVCSPSFVVVWSFSFLFRPSFLLGPLLVSVWSFLLFRLVLSPFLFGPFFIFLCSLFFFRLVLSPFLFGPFFFFV